MRHTDSTRTADHDAEGSAHPYSTLTSVGAQRRLQALAALGWSADGLAPQLFTGAGQVRRWLDGTETVPAWAWTPTRRLYDQQSMPMQLPRGQDADHARREARTRGWVPPLAWDDDVLDDPAGAPEGHEPARPPQPQEADWVVLLRVWRGQPSPRRLTRHERLVLIRWSLRAGEGASRAGQRVGISAERVCQLDQQHSARAHETELV